jgi:hypothetical protein
MRPAHGGRRYPGMVGSCPSSFSSADARCTRQRPSSMPNNDSAGGERAALIGRRVSFLATHVVRAFPRRSTRWHEGRHSCRRNQPTQIASNSTPVWMLKVKSIKRFGSLPLLISAVRWVTVKFEGWLPHGSHSRRHTGSRCRSFPCLGGFRGRRTSRAAVAERQSLCAPCALATITWSAEPQTSADT